MFHRWSVLIVQWNPLDHNGCWVVDMLDHGGSTVRT